MFRLNLQEGEGKKNPHLSSHPPLIGFLPGVCSWHAPEANLQRSNKRHALHSWCDASVCHAWTNEAGTRLLGRKRLPGTGVGGSNEMSTCRSGLERAKHDASALHVGTQRERGKTPTAGVICPATVVIESTQQRHILAPTVDQQHQPQHFSPGVRRLWKGIKLLQHN